ncbi:MAG: class II aldolase/adducin family protein [Burkholderiales bacterium]|nr:class II aldolase/adducin family protein [Burkholderiales bacterium]
MPNTPAELIDDLVAANRILAGLGVVDGFGHVSVRHPDHPDRYLLSRSLAPEQVSAADIMVFDLRSSALGGDPRTPYLERFIHGEIYARRPDVQSVVHSHAAAVVPFAASTVPLRPIYHMSAFLRTGVPVFEIREKFGMTDMLIRTNAQGAALAEKLGDQAAVLMRGHGYCVVGSSIPEAVFRAYYAQLNADLQQRAIALGGGVIYLDDEEAAKYDETNRGVLNRPWTLWKARFAPRA